MKYLANNTFLIVGKEYRFVFQDLTKPIKNYIVIWDDEGTEEIKRIVK